MLDAFSISYHCQTCNLIPLLWPSAQIIVLLLYLYTFMTSCDNMEKQFKER